MECLQDPLPMPRPFSARCHADLCRVTVKLAAIALALATSLPGGLIVKHYPGRASDKKA